jgi:hypothetical protein
MRWTFERQHSPEYIRIESRGVLTADSFASMLDALFAYDEWEPRLPILFIRRTIDQETPEPFELFKTSSVFIDKIPNLAFTKIAVVFDTPEAFERGLRFHEATTSESEAFLAIFQDEEQARSWLLGATIDPPETVHLHSKAKKA